MFLVWHAVFAFPLFPILKKEYTKLAFPKSVFHRNLVPWDLYRCCRGRNFWSNHLGKSRLNKGEEVFFFLFNHRASLSLYDAKVCGGASDRDPKSTISQTATLADLFLPQRTGVHQPVLWDPLLQFISPFAGKFTSNELMWIKRERQWNSIHLSKRPFEELSVLKPCTFFPRTRERGQTNPW